MAHKGTDSRARRAQRRKSVGRKAAAPGETRSIIVEGQTLRIRPVPPASLEICYRRAPLHTELGASDHDMLVQMIRAGYSKEMQQEVLQSVIPARRADVRYYNEALLLGVGLIGGVDTNHMQALRSLTPEGRKIVAAAILTLSRPEPAPEQPADAHSD